MLSKAKTWFSGLSKAGKGGVILASLFVMGAAANPGPNTTKIAVQASPPSVQTPQIKADQTEKKTVSETENIPFNKTTVQDSNLATGKTSLRIEGVNGVKKLTYEVTISDSVQTDKKLIKEEITTPPVTEVTAVGTKVAPPANCPNGTYTNSAGNVVCRPYESSSAPTGATAKCRDGTYSFSQSRRGTCSSHGGVSSWL